MRKACAILLLLGSTAAGIYAILTQLVTLATTDPHRYQPLLLSGARWVLLSVALTAAYVFITRGRWRLAASAPLVACGVAIYGIARMWPYAFA